MLYDLRWFLVTRVKFPDAGDTSKALSRRPGNGRLWESEKESSWPWPQPVLHVRESGILPREFLYVAEDAAEASSSLPSGSTRASRRSWRRVRISIRDFAAGPYQGARRDWLPCKPVQLMG